MLNDFIFLGQVPGTNFYITFYELEVITRVALLFAAVYCLWSMRAKPAQLALPFSALSLGGLNIRFIRPARLIGHTSLTPQADTTLQQLDLFAGQLPPDA